MRSLQVLDGELMAKMADTLVSEAMAAAAAGGKGGGGGAAPASIGRGWRKKAAAAIEVGLAALFSFAATISIPFQPPFERNFPRDAVAGASHVHDVIVQAAFSAP